jgi:hypothetical protein
MEAFKCTNIIDMNCHYSGINVYHIITNLNNIVDYNMNEFVDTVYYQLQYSNYELRKNYMICKKSMDTYSENMKNIIDYTYDQLRDNLWFYIESMRTNIYYGIKEIYNWIYTKVDTTYHNYSQLNGKLYKAFVKFVDKLNKKILPKLDSNINKLMLDIFSQMYTQYNSILFPTFEIKLNDIIQHSNHSLQHKLDLFSSELEYIFDDISMNE